MEKTCTRCLIVYPATTNYFTKKSSGMFGLNSCCKVCEKSYRQGPGREKRLIRNKGYKQTEKYKEWRSRWYQDNKESETARKRKYGDYKREYYRKNKDKVAEWNRAWRARNPDKVKQKDLARRARKANAPGVLTSRDLHDCLQKHSSEQGKYWCNWCKQDILRKDVTIDHIIPLAKGGANSPENITVACRSCNSSKGDRIIEV